MRLCALLLICLKVTDAHVIDHTGPIAHAGISAHALTQVVHEHIYKKFDSMASKIRSLDALFLQPLRGISLC